MKKFITDCDMGSIKIYNKGMSCFFSNGVGDFPNTVEIHESNIMAGINVKKLSIERRKAEFLGHFTVKTKAYLSAYDCSDDSIYEFSKGRWFVWLLKDTTFLIEKVDEDIHA